MFPLKNTEAYIHANGFRSTLGKELADRDTTINELGSEIQALTNYVLDTGVKNLFNVRETIGGNALTVVSDTGIEVKNNLASTYIFCNLKVYGLKKNTDYVFSTDVTITSGTPMVLIRNAAGTTPNLASFTPQAGTNAVTFNSGDNETITVYLYSTTDTSEVGDVLYDKLMICEASITDATYAPYAKTNAELTDDLIQATFPTTSPLANISSSANKLGPVKFLTIGTPTTAMTTNTGYALGTLPEALKPSAYISLTFTANTRNFMLNINTSGEATLTHTGGTSLPADGKPSINYTVVYN